MQRGTPPNRGQWSLPGGRIELGEQTLAAASRELSEETGLDAVDFHPHAFMVSDVIALPDFHYLIAQMYCSPADAAVRGVSSRWRPASLAICGARGAGSPRGSSTQTNASLAAIAATATTKRSSQRHRF